MCDYSLFIFRKEADAKMAEAIISRYSVGKEAETVVPITPGYHTSLVTLRSNKGHILENVIINCKDGARWYNYTTNDKGQCLFVSNSGQLNFSVQPKYKNNIDMIDQKSVSKSLDAPIGVTSKINLNMGSYNSGDKLVLCGYGDQKYPLSGYKGRWTNNFTFIDYKKVNIILGGGGGGGSGSGETLYSTKKFGGGGGGGELIIKNDIQVSYNQIYKGYCGEGGEGGIGNPNDAELVRSGHSGGTTTLLGFSAVGGGGGTVKKGGVGARNGYFGNGGYKSKGLASNDITWGGGGGGFNYNITKGGSPGGGDSGGRNDTEYISWENSPLAGFNGGGGGAGHMKFMDNSNGAHGGHGKIEIIFA